MTREEILQAISDDKMMPFIQPEQLAQIVNFVIKNYEPSLPSNLDEAAEKIVRDWLAYGDGEYKKLAIAGAEWMAGQGYTKEGIARPDDDEIWVNMKNTDIKDGDEVIVQIRKK